jgi:hypothetical protein
LFVYPPDVLADDAKGNELNTPEKQDQSRAPGPARELIGGMSHERKAYDAPQHDEEQKHAREERRDEPHPGGRRIVVKEKMPSAANLKSLSNGYLVSPAARAARSYGTAIWRNPAQARSPRTKTSRSGMSTITSTWDSIAIERSTRP